jgi:organic hydroperoxide reductase OsmC/OhrA
MVKSNTPAPAASANVTALTPEELRLAALHAEFNLAMEAIAALALVKAKDAAQARVSAAAYRKARNRAFCLAIETKQVKAFTLAVVTLNMTEREMLGLA